MAHPLRVRHPVSLGVQQMSGGPKNLNALAEG
jgi:hypothetical protein